MSPASQAIRLAAFYTAMFAIVGILAPFWPLWLNARGLSHAEIGGVIACTYLTRMIANPLVGHWADQRGDRKRPILILAMVAIALWLLFPLAHGFWPVLIVTLLAYMPFNAMMPVGDSLAMMIVAREKLDYGRIRLWGSLAFIAAAALVGQALLSWPVTVVPWMVIALLVVLAGCCALLPDIRLPRRLDQPPPPVRPLLRNGPFLLFLAATALNQASHAVYYPFATLHWSAAGLSDATIGLLWSEGVIAEVALFAFSGLAVARLGPTGLLVAAGLGGAVRWTALSLTTDPLVLALAQPLHAATFGCAHLGAMHFIQRAVPASLSARAQGVYAAIAVGLVPGLASALAGPLYDRLRGEAFLVMAVLAAAAAMLSWGLTRQWRGDRLIAEGNEGRYGA